MDGSSKCFDVIPQLPAYLTPTFLFSVSNIINCLRNYVSCFRFSSFFQIYRNIIHPCYMGGYSYLCTTCKKFHLFRSAKS